MKLSALSKKMIMAVCVSALVFIAAGAVFFRSREIIPFALGVLLVSAVNCVKVIMLERAAIKATRSSGNPAESAAAMIGVQYFARLLLTGGVLLICVLSPHISVVGAALGVLTMQAAAVFAKRFGEGDEPEQSGQ